MRRRIYIFGLMFLAFKITAQELKGQNHDTWAEANKRYAENVAKSNSPIYKSVKKTMGENALKKAEADRTATDLLLIEEMGRVKKEEETQLAIELEAMTKMIEIELKQKLVDAKGKYKKQETTYFFLIVINFTLFVISILLLVLLFKKSKNLQ